MLTGPLGDGSPRELQDLHALHLISPSDLFRVVLTSSLHQVHRSAFTLAIEVFDDPFLPFSLSFVWVRPRKLQDTSYPEAVSHRVSHGPNEYAHSLRF